MPIMTVPFSGFYESIWSQLIDNEVERFIENSAEERGIDSSGSGPLWDWNLIFDCMDYAGAYNALAKAYVEVMEDKFHVGMTFESMHSPREYNFQTDRIFVEIPPDQAERIVKVVRETDAGIAALTEIVQSRFKSRSGFISHYTSQIDPWLTLSVEDMDHNELATFFLAFMELKLDDEGQDWDEFEWCIYYALAEQSYMFFEENFDFEKWNKGVEELLSPVTE